MKLTKEQRAEIKRQRDASPGLRSFQITMTSDQRAAHRAAIAEEMASRGANLAHVRAANAALQEPTLSGALRRAIRNSHRLPRELAGELNISVRQLDEFRTGVSPLPSDVIDQLIALLDLEVIVAEMTTW